MEIKEFLLEYKKYLLANADPIRAKNEKAYLYSDLKHYGLTAKLQKWFFQKQKRGLKLLDKRDALALVKQLWDQPSFEERMLALEILVLHESKLNSDDLAMIEKLIRESRGWALLDNFVIQVMPGLLNREPKLYAVLQKWIKDSDFWVRRSALLAQLQFFHRGNGGDMELFMSMAKSQFDEAWIDEIYTDALQRKRARFFIRKAIGWSLRVLGTTRPEVVVEFLNLYKGQMSGLSYREGSRRLAPEFAKQLV